MHQYLDDHDKSMAQVVLDWAMKFLDARPHTKPRLNGMDNPGLSCTRVFSRGQWRMKANGTPRQNALPRSFTARSSKTPHDS